MICNKCHIDKDITEFPKRTDTKKGVRGTCKLCTNESKRQWWKNNRNVRLKYAQKWYANNRKKIIKQKISSNLKMRRLARLDCIEYYSNGKNCCECCGEKHLEFLAIDHISGKGGKHRKNLKEYLPLILKRNNYPTGYRILCHNCNMSIGFYGYCPHNKEK
jgi:hypothetical protein